MHTTRIAAFAFITGLALSACESNNGGAPGMMNPGNQPGGQQQTPGGGFGGPSAPSGAFGGPSASQTGAGSSFVSPDTTPSTSGFGESTTATGGGGGGGPAGGGGANCAAAVDNLFRVCAGMDICEDEQIPAAQCRMFVQAACDMNRIPALTRPGALECVARAPTCEAIEACD